MRIKQTIIIVRQKLKTTLFFGKQNIKKPFKVKKKTYFLNGRLDHMDSGLRVEVRDESAERRAFRVLDFEPVIISHVSKRDEAALIQNSVQVQ